MTFFESYILLVSSYYASFGLFSRSSHISISFDFSKRFPRIYPYFMHKFMTNLLISNFSLIFQISISGECKAFVFNLRRMMMLLFSISGFTTPLSLSSDTDYTITECLQVFLNLTLKKSQL